MNIERFTEYLTEQCGKVGVAVTKEQAGKLYEYKNLILLRNKSVNLTSITDSKDIIIKHFVDSLTVSGYLSEKATVADVGTGAGFPGIPLKICRDDLNVTLIDSLSKRVQFLDETCGLLGLNGIQAFHMRAEDAGRDKRMRESFDFAVARAVAPLSVLCEYCLPLVNVGGKFIAMKGQHAEDEILAASNAVKVLGGEVCDEVRLNVANNARSLVIIEKTRNTPNVYPRKAGTASKRPL